MKIELISVVDMWEELRNCDIDRIKSLWDDDDIFESVSMDEFVDDVNEWYRKKEGFNFRGGWFWSSFVNLDEMGVNVSLDNNYGEYIEREVDDE
jgi:hypothetical protein